MPAKELTALITVTQQILHLLQGEWREEELDQRLLLRHQLIENLRKLPPEQRMRTGENAQILQELDNLTRALLEQLRAVQEEIRLSQTQTTHEQQNLYRSQSAMQAYQGPNETVSHFIQQER